MVIGSLRFAAASKGANCASSGGEVGPSFPILLTRVQERPEIAPLLCRFRNETEMVRYVVIYTVMLPGILGGGNIPL